MSRVRLYGASHPTLSYGTHPHFGSRCDALARGRAGSRPRVEQPQTNATDDQQQQFVEATAPIVRAGAPVALFALVVGAMLAAVRAVGG